MKILFWLRKAKTNKANSTPIMCRITVNSVRANDFSIGIRTEAQLWDSKRQRIKGNDKLTALYNARLTHIKADIEQIWLEFEKRQTPTTAQKIVNIYLNKEKQYYTLVEATNLFLDVKTRELDNALITLSTYNIWKRRRQKIFDYLTHTKQKDLLLSQIKKTFADELYRHSLAEGLQHNSASRLVSSLKTILDFAQSEGYHAENPLAGVSYTQNDVPTVYLTEFEANQLCTYPFANSTLQKMQDYCIIQIYTGLNYSDIQSLSIKHIKQGNDGRDWIIKERDKKPIVKKGTDSMTYRLPLLEKPKQVIEKYGGIEHLPIFTNQRCNFYLKEMAKIIGIEKRITTHVLRKTFGYLALNIWGIPIETVSKMMGHDNIAMTQKSYAKILDDKIANDMKDIK